MHQTVLSGASSSKREKAQLQHLNQLLNSDMQNLKQSKQKHFMHWG
jgi:hypothetical protein